MLLFLSERIVASKIPKLLSGQAIASAQEPGDYREGPRMTGEAVQLGVVEQRLRIDLFAGVDLINYRGQKNNIAGNIHQPDKGCFPLCFF